MGPTMKTGGKPNAAPNKGAKGAKNVNKKTTKVIGGKVQKKLKPNNPKKGLEEKEQKPIPENSNATVFVGNLPINTKRKQIAILCAKFGTVKGIRMRTAGGQVIFKHKQRKAAGSLNAYVVFSSEEEAKAALVLNGTEFKGVHLRVNPSDKSNHTEADKKKRTIFVGNLKYSANEEKLHSVFSSCGEIDYVRCVRDGNTSSCKGVAYICFKSPESVGLALELNETLLDDRPIHVERYSLKKSGAKQARDAANKDEAASSTSKKTSNDASKAPKKTKDPKKAKADYHGVKANGINKKKKSAKKQQTKMNKLAKKIAPKILEKSK